MSSLAEIIAKTKKQISENQGKYEKPVKVPAGASRWRVMPGWDPKNPDQFFQPFGQHFIKDADGKVAAVAVCQERTHSAPCAVCDMIARGYDSARSDDERNALKEMKAAQRYLINAVRVDVTPQEVSMLELPQSAFEGILVIAEEHMVDGKTAVLDPGVDGVDVVINKTGTGLSTDYNVTVGARNKSVPIDKNLLMKLKDLGAYVKSADELAIKKAAARIGAVSGAALGITAATTSPAFGGPGMAALSAPADATAPAEKPRLDLKAELDDEIPAAAAPKIAAEIEEAEVVAAAPAPSAAPSVGGDVSDEELQRMLDGL